MVVQRRAIRNTALGKWKRLAQTHLLIGLIGRRRTGRPNALCRPSAPGMTRASPRRLERGRCASVGVRSQTMRYPTHRVGHLMQPSCCPFRSTSPSDHNPILLCRGSTCHLRSRLDLSAVTVNYSKPFPVGPRINEYDRVGEQQPIRIGLLKGVTRDSDLGNR